MMNCPTSVVDVGSVCVAHARNSSIWSGDSRPVPPFRSNRTSASTPPSWNSLSQMRMVESSMNSASATAAKDQPRSSSRTAFARRETRFSSSPSLAIATRSTRSAALRKLRFVFTRRLESIPVIRSNDFRKGEESRYIGDAGLGKTEKPHLSLFDQISDRDRHLLDRDRRINAVLIEEVDMVGFKPAERTLDRF